MAAIISDCLSDHEGSTPSNPAIKTHQLQTYFNDLNYVYSFQVEAPAPLEIEFIECLDSIKTKCSKRVLFDFNN